MRKEEKMENIVIENKRLRLEIDENCIVQSLICKSNREELLADERIPCFSVTQQRPFNNEIKLIYMNKRTTFPANRVRKEGDSLIVGFELAPYEAKVKVEATDYYIAFTLEDFIVHPDDYDYLRMDTPPAVEFRLMALPVKNRKNFGDWLNITWDDEVAVGVLATSPHARIDSEKRSNCRILTADAVKGVKLRGCTAALIATGKADLFECLDALEEDYSMPKGVKSRQSEFLNYSIYRCSDMNPKTVDKYIEYMKMGGFRCALIYYESIFEPSHRYSLFNEFKFRPEYERGLDSLKELLAKLKAAGIIPGFHFLHTHIGVETHYVTPHADRRLNLTTSFTLAKPLSLDDTVIYVDQDPTGAPMHKDRKILRFGTEIIRYEGYTTERPYTFYGCKRGEYKTEIVTHGLGEYGGNLDISEFTATSIYLDQSTDLQDEIADKLAEVYNLGFKFAYFDGSEGTSAPYEFHVPNAQLKVYDRFINKPLFCEAAAKSHFSWHMLNGGNAFDPFNTSLFKTMIDRFAVVAAKEMRKNFTRVNFGWWTIYDDTRPDVFEYGMMRAVAWDCPVTVIARNIDAYDSCYLLRDSFEAFRRWETAKHEGFFTDELKKTLRETKDEHTLLINEEGDYELCPVREVKTGVENLYAFIFTRRGFSFASLSYVGEGVKVKMPVSDSVQYLERDLKTDKEFDTDNGNAIFSVSKLAYVKTKMSEAELEKAIKEITEI